MKCEIPVDQKIFFSFFNILFARLCIYFATSCEGSKKFPHLWINVFHLHDGEEMEDRVKTDLIYAVRVKTRNWYSTCRPVVMERDQRMCHMPGDTIFPGLKNSVFSSLYKWVKLYHFPSSPRREETKIKLFYLLPIQNRCLLSYGLDAFYIFLYHI